MKTKAEIQKEIDNLVVAGLAIQSALLDHFGADKFLAYATGGEL